jgi:DNA-binding transcriptional MocR family regulator
MAKHPEIHWTHPHGGLYVWLTLPQSINTSRTGEMFGLCIDRGVLYVPGEYCFQADEKGFVPENQLRLSFGQVAPDKIEPGIERLASVVHDLLANRQPAVGNRQFRGAAS